jgi:N-acetylated-alpha-linked acidic dipeptidase
MVDEKHLYDVHDHLPIPTYEEATSSRPTSQQSRLGPEEISDDAERQGLLGYGSSNSNNGAGSSSRRRNGYYQPPSVQSVRSSMDSDELELPEVTGGDEDEDGPALRREMEQMEMLDAEAADDDAARRARVRSRLSR